MFQHDFHNFNMLKKPNCFVSFNMEIQVYEFKCASGCLKFIIIGLGNFLMRRTDLR